MRIFKCGWWNNNSSYIYLSHILSSWSDRMWSFSIGLHLVILYPQSLQLTAIYGFATCISVIIFAPLIGKWIDKSRRIVAAQWALIIQNSSVIICCGLLIILLHFSKELESQPNLKTTGISLIILIAIISNLASEATKIVLEKDWIVVLAGGDETRLSKMNSTMRSIDLTTFILAPIIVGQIITYVSQIGGTGFIAGWNLVSVFIEYALIRIIYNRVPALAIKNVQNSPSAGTNTTTKRSEFPKNIVISLKNKGTETLAGWKDYFNHPIKFAGIGLACLYMTVLGFDNITVGYAYSQGISESSISIMTGAGALVGILGSLAFPHLRNKFGKYATGNIGFGLLTFSLVSCVVSVFATGSPFLQRDSSNIGIAEVMPSARSNSSTQISAEISATQVMDEFLNNSKVPILLLMSGIILARFGLWVADLTVVQFFQEGIAEDKRGILNGVQGAFNQFMNLIKFLLVIFLPRPETFGYLIFLSWTFVFMGWISFMFFTCLHSKFKVNPENESDEVITRF